MNKSVIFMFSGQGSQFYNMGRELFFSNYTFHKWMSKLDGIFYNITGRSVIKVLYNDEINNSEPFYNILYTHPAIFMIEYSLSQVLIEGGIKPDYVLGYSLGEFTSSAVAGIMDYKDVFHCIIKQSQLLDKYCEKGSMLTIMHDYRLYNEEPLLYENATLAAVNFEQHFVVSGSIGNLTKIEKFLRLKHIAFFRLPVPYAFHSSLIDSIGREFIKFTKSKKLKLPQVPVFSCFTGGELKNVEDNYFWNVTRRYINFQSVVNKLQGDGKNIFLDIGPSGTLANFMKYNARNKDLNTFSVIMPYGSDVENLNKLLNKVNSHCLSKSERGNEEMLSYVFPGQGSQFKGMGGSLFDEFAEMTLKADRVLGYSIKNLCLEDPDYKLGKTNFTQPAVYVVNSLIYLKTIEDTGRKPDYVAGHSLGEYNALFASGVFDFETGLKLVKKRGELMSKAGEGGMAAVIGLSEEMVRKVLEDNSLDEIDIANINTPTQIVISGPKTAVQEAEEIFKFAGAVSYVILNVSGAFHSRYMKEAAESFEEYLKQFEFNKISIPVISNVYARPYKQEDLKNNLVKQITSSVKWTESIRYLMGKKENIIQQIGLGHSLQKMVDVIQEESQPLMVDDDELKPKDIANKWDDSYDLRENKASSIEKIKFEITPELLGSSEFKREYGVKYAYLIGAMHMGIASKELVVRAGKAGLIAILGTGGLEIDAIEKSIQYIQEELRNGEAYGVNLIHNYNDSKDEGALVDLLLKYNVRTIEASAFIRITPALVRYRINGLSRDENGKVVSNNKIISKISRPEVAEVFLKPAPEHIINKLLEEGEITNNQALMAKEISMADDLCAEANSGGYTDQGTISALLPAIISLRDKMKGECNNTVRVGVAGGIGTPEAAAAAFVLGADFIMTGSINQCTVEAGTSDIVKDMLQETNVQDTTYVPGEAMFEVGSKIQVLKRGVFFPARANRLYEIYCQYDSIDEIDTKVKILLEEKYLKNSMEKIYEDIKSSMPIEEIDRAERNPKYKMALIFKWYFKWSFKVALYGERNNVIDYQVHCGSALGAFNQWCKGTALENWRNRHVDEIGIEMMTHAAKYINNRFKSMICLNK